MGPNEPSSARCGVPEGLLGIGDSTLEATGVMRGDGLCD
jgi:hypothetical protein